MVVEVAGRMSDALGSYYALSEVCPFFISVGERTRGIRCRRERRRARSWRAPPWRAFANDVQWKRDPRFISSVLASLRDALKGSAPAVTCVNLGAESGSGLTTFLMEVAFRLAQSGYPTLIAKPELRRIDYELLRTFLEHLSVGQSVRGNSCRTGVR